MPEMILIGWFHTGFAIVALIAGFYSLITFKVIAEDRRAGQIYLICTLITAVTALMIYQHSGFGPGHGLAVLTLLALAGGMLVTRIALFGALSVYIQTFCYSATLLFHMIPAITDGLLRLPTQNPVLTDPKDPLLGKFYLAFFVVFLIVFVLQVLWLRKQNRS